MSEESKLAFVSHGFMDDYLTPWWGPVEDNLDLNGYETEFVSFDGFLRTVGSPEKYGEELGRELEQRLSQHYEELDEIIVIGHSMGGLIARYALEELGYAEEVDRLVTFGTPHQGTKIAEPFTELFEGAEDMETGSDFLQYLNGDGVASDLEYMNFYTPDDSAFLDYRNAEIPVEAENVENIKIGDSHGEVIAENVIDSVELGFDLMFDACQDLQKLAFDTVLQPWRLATPSYWAEFNDPERTEKRLKQLQDVIYTDPQEFYTGHTTMFFNDELWNEFENQLT